MRLFDQADLGLLRRRQAEKRMGKALRQMQDAGLVARSPAKNQRRVNLDSDLEP